MPTKEDLENEVKSLKQLIRTMKSEIKLQASDKSQLPRVTHALTLDPKDNSYKLMTLRYSLDTNNIYIDSITDLSPDVAVARYKYEEIYIMNMIRDMRKENEK